MKKYALLIVVVLVAAVGGERLLPGPGGSAGSVGSKADTGESTRIAEAFRDHAEALPVQGQGTVEATLPDDTRGSQHQRFILRLADGHTVLIAHNIDLAPRIPVLERGDAVHFKGVYEWNPEGGVVHWTHRDPDGRHAGGWLRHAGTTYQ